jgi:hypothetical protein
MELVRHSDDIQRRQGRYSVSDVQIVYGGGSAGYWPITGMIWCALLIPDRACTARSGDGVDLQNGYATAERQSNVEEYLGV